MRNWIDLFENAEPTLEFDHREDCWTFNGFHVYAELLGDPKQCLGIMSFSSHKGGQGNGERALRWLKEHVPAIHVYDPGQPGTDAFAFWKRMCDKGLIDSMEDADGNIIYRDGEWAELEESATGSVQRMSIEKLPFQTKQEIITMLLSNCPPFEKYWMAHESVMTFNETYVSQFIFGYEIEYHPEGDGTDSDDWFPVDVLELDPQTIDNANRSVSDNVVTQYAALKTAPPPILVKRQGSGWKIVEGGHRLAAAKQNGAKSIRAVDVTIFFKTDYAALGESALNESAPHTLYHGTLKAYIPEIEKNGLVPTVGEFVSHFYDPSGDEGYDPETDSLEPLVFAASKRDLQRCVNAIIFRLRDDRIDATYENVIKYGAIVAYRDADEQFYKRPKDGERDYGDHPTQVEPGDFYSYEDIAPTYIVTGKRLRDLLRRNRIDGFVSPRPPIREAKYLDAWNCWQNPNGVALNNLLVKHGDLRGMCETLPDGKTSVYVWPALDEVHHRMREKLGVEQDNCFSFYVCPTSAQFEDIPNDEERGDWVYGAPFAEIGNAAIYVEEDGKAACATNTAFIRMTR